MKQETFELKGIPQDRLILFVGPAVLIIGGEIVCLLLSLVAGVSFFLSLSFTIVALGFWLIWLVSIPRQGRGLVKVDATDLRIETPAGTKLVVWEDVVDLRIEPGLRIGRWSLESSSSAQTIAIRLANQLRVGFRYVTTRGFGIPAATNILRFRIESAEEFLSSAESYRRWARESSAPAESRHEKPLGQKEA